MKSHLYGWFFKILFIYLHEYIALQEFCFHHVVSPVLDELKLPASWGEHV